MAIKRKANAERMELLPAGTVFADTLFGKRMMDLQILCEVHFFGCPPGVGFANAFTPHISIAGEKELFGDRRFPMGKALLRLATVAAALAFAAPAVAQFQVQITSPAPNTRVTPGGQVTINFTVSGAVVGVSQVVVSGERDPFGNTTLNYPSFPLQNTVNDFAFYDIPLDAGVDEELTVQVTATGFADAPVNAFLTLLGPAGPTAPANDNLASSQGIAGATGTVTGTTVAATKQPSEANHGGNAGGNSVWYTWLSPGDGEVTFDTVGSSINTLLGVYTGSSFPLTLVGDNDDTTGTASEVTAQVVDSGIYRIAVDGFGSVEGAITLNWSFVEAAAAEPTWAMYE